MTETLALTLRVGLSFTFVLGLMWLAARLLRGKLAARGEGVLEVLARQQVGRGASVAVVRVADRALIVGITEHGVSMLGDPISDLTLLAAPAAEEPSAGLLASTPGYRGTPLGSSTAGRLDGDGGPLKGSLLSPTTWRQALHVLRERTVRR